MSRGVNECPVTYVASVSTCSRCGHEHAKNILHCSFGVTAV